jgi:hypothetical protein
MDFFKILTRDSRTKGQTKGLVRTRSLVCRLVVVVGHCESFKIQEVSVAVSTVLLLTHCHLILVDCSVSAAAFTTTAT